MKEPAIKLKSWQYSISGGDDKMSKKDNAGKDDHPIHYSNFKQNYASARILNFIGIFQDFCARFRTVGSAD